MNYLCQNIDRAIVHALGLIHTVETVDPTAKTLEVVPRVFFRMIAGEDHGAEESRKPPEHCDRFTAGVSEIEAMCKCLRHDTTTWGDGARNSGQFKMICEIIRRSEQLMANFNEAHKAGNYHRNSGYLRQLDDSNDWGRSMIAMRNVFLPGEGNNKQAVA